MSIQTPGVISASILSFLLGLGTISAQPLPPFVDGQVLTASQLNTIVERITDQTAALETLQAALTTARNDITRLQREISVLRDLVGTKANQSDFLALQGTVQDLQAHPVLALAPYVEVQDAQTPINGLAGPHIIFHGANVHIESGSGATDDRGTPSGLGNLVIGYNEAPLGPPQPGQRGGAHNLIVGRQHRYSSVGGLVAGFANTISGIEANVSGGALNTASGVGASVSGGVFNTANGRGSSVSGGTRNTASADVASVNGGASNTARGVAASVSGGNGNTAIGEQSNVSGGNGRSAPQEDDWVGGSLLEDF